MGRATPLTSRKKFPRQRYRNDVGYPALLRQFRRVVSRSFLLHFFKFFSVGYSGLSQIRYTTARSACIAEAVPLDPPACRAHVCKLRAKEGEGREGREVEGSRDGGTRRKRTSLRRVRRAHTAPTISACYTRGECWDIVSQAQSVHSAPLVPSRASRRRPLDFSRGRYHVEMKAREAHCSAKAGVGSRALCCWGEPRDRESSATQPRTKSKSNF